MKHLSELVNIEFGNSLTAKRAQVRNEIWWSKSPAIRAVW